MEYVKCYLAAPIVGNCASTNSEIDRVYEALVVGFSAEHVYRPGQHKVPNEWGIDIETWAQCVFTMDVLAIDACDWIVVCDYGRFTAGTAWECGYAFAKQKKILVIKMPNVKESSLMLRGCASNVVEYDKFVNHNNPGMFFVERGKLPRTEILN